MSIGRGYALLGATGAGAVTAALWFGVGVATPWALTASAVGAALGGALGLLAGDGSIQEAWTGWTGALLIPPISAALLNVLVILVVGSHTR
jgi:hypothetical protein